jgi:hypothetical protein
MLLIRYFVFTGGVLLGLLLLADRYFHLATAVAAEDDTDRSIIRIHSSQRWPAAIQFDTNAPIPATVAGAAPVPTIPDSTSQAYGLQRSPLQQTHERIRRHVNPSRVTSHVSRQRVANDERRDASMWPQNEW